MGHSTWLLQIDGVNILTDPHWSERASPFSWAGPMRMTRPGIPFDALPRIDLVVVSHDHYDHLDAGTVSRLARRFGSGLAWATPLGYGRWFRRFGVRPIEMDWWETRQVAVDGDRRIELTCLPAQHWTFRAPWDRMRRLWCSWGLRSGGRAAYFGGDSGWFPEYGHIGAQAGPFDLTLLPIGAYEPRWFMKSSHMNPEDAVRAFLEMDETRGAGTMAGMHWGSFRLTDEHPLEPPVHLERAWREAGLAEDRLWSARLGETRRIEPSGDERHPTGMAAD